MHCIPHNYSQNSQTIEATQLYFSPWTTSSQLSFDNITVVNIFDLWY